LAGIITFTTATGGSIAEGTGLFTVTLSHAYSSAEFAVICSISGPAGASTGLLGGSLIASQATSGTFTVYATVAFTPASATPYSFSYITMAAGATT
jgi:hypothetical protein